MMTEIFERKKSPFYHFGKLMHLDKIPYDDFKKYISLRLPLDDESRLSAVVDELLSFTNLHPYYTQQLASQVWELMTYDGVVDNVVKLSIEQIVDAHDLDFERLWQNFNRMDRQILQRLSKDANPFQNRQVATSTTYSGLKRLMKMGYVIKLKSYEIEDPFFKKWILRSGI